MLGCCGRLPNLAGARWELAGSDSTSGVKKAGTVAVVERLRENAAAATINRPLVTGTGARATVIEGRDKLLTGRALPNQGNLPFAVPSRQVVQTAPVTSPVPDTRGPGARRAVGHSLPWTRNAAHPPAFAKSSYVGPTINSFWRNKR